MLLVLNIRGHLEDCKRCPCFNEYIDTALAIIQHVISAYFRIIHIPLPNLEYRRQ